MEKPHKAVTSSKKCKGGERLRQGQVIYLSFMAVKQLMLRVRRALAYTVRQEDLLCERPRDPIILAVHR